MLNICRFGFAQIRLYLVLERFVEPHHINWLLFLGMMIKLCSLRLHLNLESLIELLVYLPHLTVVDLIMLIQAVPRLERFVESLLIYWRHFIIGNLAVLFGKACTASLMVVFLEWLVESSSFDLDLVFKKIVASLIYLLFKRFLLKS